VDSGAVGAYFENEIYQFINTLAKFKNLFRQQISSDSNKAFRVSMLTRVLKRALTRGTKILIIGNISPNPQFYHQSLENLTFTKKAFGGQLG
jgi:hypothetical protein